MSLHGALACKYMEARHVYTCPPTYVAERRRAGHASSRAAEAGDDNQPGLANTQARQRELEAARCRVVVNGSCRGHGEERRFCQSRPARGGSRGWTGYLVRPVAVSFSRPHRPPLGLLTKAALPSSHMGTEIGQAGKRKSRRLSTFGSIQGNSRLATYCCTSIQVAVPRKEAPSQAPAELRYWTVRAERYSRASTPTPTSSLPHPSPPLSLPPLPTSPLLSNLSLASHPHHSHAFFTAMHPPPCTVVCMYIHAHVGRYGCRPGRAVPVYSIAVSPPPPYVRELGLPPSSAC